MPSILKCKECTLRSQKQIIYGYPKHWDKQSPPSPWGFQPRTIAGTPPPARGQGPGQAQGPGGCSEANFPELWIFDEPKKIFRPFIFLKNPLSHGFQSYFRRICKPDDPNNYRDMLFWSKCIPPWFTNVPLFQPKAKFFLDPSCPRTTPVGGHVFERVGKDPPPWSEA
jgi:hypothetical protein